MNSGDIIMFGCIAGVIIGVVWMFKRRRDINKRARKLGTRVEPFVDSLDLGDD